MKNLISKLIAVPLIAGTLASCGNLTRPREFPEKMIHGVEYQTLMQDRVPYKLEEQILYGDREYFETTNKLPNCLSIVIKRFLDITREMDLDSGKVELKSENIYIPYKVELTNFTKDKWADEVALTSIGPFGIKANVETLEELSEIAGEDRNIYGYKVVTIEEGASFAIRTIKILGNEYFFPMVENSKLNEKGKLNYYLIPVNGAKIKIKNTCGNVYIRNENNIYRPTNPKLFHKSPEGIKSFHR